MLSTLSSTGILFSLWLVQYKRECFQIEHTILYKKIMKAGPFTTPFHLPAIAYSLLKELLFELSLLGKVFLVAQQPIGFLLETVNTGHH